MAGKCTINRDCKINPINSFIKQYKNDDIVQYIGIAADEPRRLRKMEGTNRISLLEKYGCTEQDAFEICGKYGLLSPTYEFTKRGGVLVLPECEVF